MIIAYDKNFKKIANIDNYISFIWHEKLFDVGSFELVVNSQIPDFAGIYPNEFTEAAIIEGVYIKDTVTYIGRMLKAELSDEIILNTENFTNKTPDEIAKALVLKYGNIAIDPVATISNIISNLQVTGKNLMEYTTDLLSEHLIWCKVNYDYYAEKKTFITGHIVDATQTKAPLSVEFENINGFSYANDMSKFKNFAFVAGEGEGSQRIIVEVDLTNGENRKAIYVDAKDLIRENLSLEQYKEILKQRGKEKLAEHKPVMIIDIDPNLNLILGEKRLFKDKKTGLLSEQICTELITIQEKGRRYQKAMLGLQNIRRNDNV